MQPFASAFTQMNWGSKVANGLFREVFGFFLKLPGIPPRWPTEESSDRSSLTVICGRLAQSVLNAVFQRILTLAREKSLLKGQTKTIVVDSTTLDASRRGHEENWLARARGTTGRNKSPGG